MLHRSAARPGLSLLVLLALLLGLVVTSGAQSPKQQALQTGAAATGNGTPVSSLGYSLAAVQVVGTFVGTVTFEATVDGSNFASVLCTSITDGSTSTTATAAGTWFCPVSGTLQFRARVSAYTSGSITVQSTLLAQVSRPAPGVSGGGTGAPSSAHYVTTQAESSLSAEVSLGSLTTGLLLNTVSGSVGTPSAYAGASCTNQFPRSLDAAGAPTCASVALATDVSGLLGLASGGTGADLSATGGTSQVLKQTTAGGVVTVARLACADLSDSSSGCTSSGTSFANPTASVGLSAVNGSASTAMRSDAAPALDQTIAPTWTGAHTFSKTTGNILVADTTTLIVDATNHRVGIGAAPSMIFHVTDNANDIAAARQSIRLNSSQTLTANNANSWIGSSLSLSLNQASFNATSGSGAYIGSSASVSATGTSGTVSALVGHQASISNTGAGTVSNAYTFNAIAPTNSGGGTLSTWHGYFAGAATAASTVYGFRGLVASTANRWNLYMDGTAQNYLAGNLGIGSGKSAPGVAVDANGVINAVSGFQVAGIALYEPCVMVIGADNGVALVDADLGPQGQQCKIPNASTVKEIVVNADAGTPNVIVRKKHCGTFTAGVCTSWTSTDLLSSALAAAASNFDACSNTGGTTGLDGGTTCSATLQNTSLAAGDWVELKSGTAGGTAKRVSVSVVRSVP